MEEYILAFDIHNSFSIPEATVLLRKKVYPYDGSLFIVLSWSVKK